ncbi:MAG: PHB depolymerase family esterase, partial [Bacteroidota bacterium]
LWMMCLQFSCKGDPVNEPDFDELINEDAETIVHDGLTREYLLHMPSSYTGTTALPLVLNFHGFGGTASDHMEAADMRSLANSDNFILVYPQGAFLDGDTHWNSGLDTPDNKSDVDDLGFIEALLDELAANYNIDPERIYACGYSNGSFFSYALACYLSDRIASIGSVAGAMMEETHDNCAPTHPTAMINVHGTSDGVVQYNGGTGMKSVPESVDYWTNFNNCNATPVTDQFDDNGTVIEQFEYQDGDSSVAVVHYKVNGGGHVWDDSWNFQGANTSRLIWEFLSQFNVHGRI